MEYRISATDLARRLGDVLGRIRYRGDSFLVERNGALVARIGPPEAVTGPTLDDTLDAWDEASHHDASFADDLERVNAEDRVPEDRWGS
jgi:hypothetical protein